MAHSPPRTISRPSDATRESRRQSPLWLLIAATVLILLVANWAGRDGTSVDQGTGPGAGGVAVDAAGDQEEKAGETEGRTHRTGRRPDGTPSRPFLLDFSLADTIGAPELIFPETEDFATSKPLEVALSLPHGDLIGWLSDDRGESVADGKVTLTYEEDVPEGEDPPTLVTASSSSGLFEFEQVPPGRWTLMAEKADYGSTSIPSVRIDPAVRNGPIQMALGPELKLSGRVQFEGRPISGARVSVLRNQVGIHGGETFQLRIPYGDATTNGEGAFEIGQLPPAKMTLRVEAESFARHQQEVTVREGLGALSVDLNSESVIAGALRNELGHPVEGAEMTLRVPGSKDKEPYAKVKSGAGGEFLFSRLPANRLFHLFVKAKNYADLGPIDVRSGTTTNVIVLTTGGAIMGRVTDFDTGGPVAGIRVVAVSQDLPNQVLLSSKSNSRGFYRIARLPQGIYNVVINSDRLTSEPREGVKVPTNGVAGGTDFVVYPGLTIEGTVVDGESRERIPNANVTVQSRVGPGLLTARNTNTHTDESGNFMFRNLPQGVYSLQASAEGYMQGVGEDSSRRVELLRGATASPVEIPLYPGGVIEGIVTDPRGTAIDDAVVQLFHASGTPSRINVGPFTTRTTLSGRFIMEGIPIHNEVFLQVSAVADGWAKDKSEPVVLNSNQRFRQANVTLTGGGNVEVMVRDTGGMGIPEANVNLSHGGFPGDPAPSDWSTKTNQEGRAFFSSIPPGRVNVGVSKSGYLGGGGSANVADGEMQILRIQLEEALTMTGRIQDDRGVPLTSGQVVLRAEAGASGGGSTSIGNDGTFEISSLGKGTFGVQIDARPGTSTGGRRIIWTYNGVVPNHGMGDIVFEVPSNGYVEGSVSLPRDAQPPTRYRIDVRGQYTDSAGNRRNFSAAHNFDWGLPFSMERIPPGTYTVTASAPDYIPVESEEIMVTSPGRFSVGDLPLETGGKLRFRTIHSRTGEPIGGATGRLVPDGPSARTNNNGEALINPVPPGIYTLEIRHGEYLDRDVELVQVVRLRENDMGDVRLDPGAILHGRVVDGLGDPLRSILVEARTNEGDNIRTTRTDPGGRYRFTGLQPGGQIVTFSGTVNRRKLSQSTDVSLSSDSPTELNATLNANSRIQGTLTAPSNVLLDRTVVTAYPLRSNRTPIVNESIAGKVEGNRFMVEDLTHGLYLLTAEAPAAGGETLAWDGEVVVDAPVNSTFLEAGVISLVGRILNGPGGAPVAGQAIRLELLTSPTSGISGLRRWWRWNATTDASGRFRIDNLPSGTYSLVAHNEELSSDILEVLQLRRSRDRDNVLQMSFYFSDDLY